MIHRTCVVGVLVMAASAHADDTDKYKRIDEARVAIIAALDKGDAQTFATYLGATLEVTDLWFDTPACRKKFATARVTPKTAAAFVACISPLHVYGRGLNVYYGPEVLVRAKIEVGADGKATLRSIAGERALDPALPEVWSKGFETNRASGDATIALDDAAHAELAKVGETGVVIKLCVDAKGKIAKSALLPKVDARGPTAKLVAAALATWTFKPFTARDKPIGACTTLTAK